MTKLTTASGRPASRLGLGGSPDMEPGCVQAAWSGGVNWFFLYNLTFTGMIEGLVPLIRQHRDDIILATGCEAREPAAAEHALEAACRRLGVEKVDVFFAEYVNPDDDLDDLLARGGLLDTLASWREAGRLRCVGASCHSRPVATQLLASGRIDVLMHRYNMAHRGAEAAVLPAAQAADVPVVAFTCTRWGSLLEGHRDWTGPAPSAADCYRFALTHPAVRLALMAPRTEAQTRQNLAALSAAAPSTAELEAWQRYGALVYGRGTDAFETEYP